MTIDLPWGVFELTVALVCAVIAAGAGWFVPRIVAILPEPPAASEEKIPYADLAARPGLAWQSALASGLSAAFIGGALGWHWALLFLIPLVPIGVALAYIDWRTRLLPTAIIGPSYLAVIPLLIVAALADGEPKRLLAALIGWVLYGGLYWLLWRFTPGMGYGDVRLSGLLGLVLGWLGPPALLAGLYAGFVLGVIAWLPMRLLRITTSRTYPFGPFMLLGVLVGVGWGVYSS
jgi:leader peptidase (prepilin peptidase)/N-methyltransferase